MKENTVGLGEYTDAQLLAELKERGVNQMSRQASEEKSNNYA